MDKLEIKDLFGLEPYGQIGLEVTKASIAAVSSFLKIVFKPGLEEVSYLLKDQIRMWRLNNILRILEKAQGRMCFDGKELSLTANPRVGLAIMEEGSAVDDEGLQDLWAGLFVSSCTPDGRDDSNMNFVDLLRRMSSVEARILDYACRNSKKLIFPNQLILATELVVPFDELARVAGSTDVYRLDNELDHMRSIELFADGGAFGDSGGYSASDKLDANITPSALALSLFYKAHSTGQSPAEFWGDSLTPVNES